jgi:hypothetical protein
VLHHTEHKSVGARVLLSQRSGATGGGGFLFMNS